MTVLLSRSDLEGLLDVGDCLAGLRRGFLAEPSPIAAQRVHTDLPGSRTATALIPGLVEGIPAYTVKVNAKFPGSRPALRGVVCLAALRTWDRLTVCDTDPGRARDFAARHGGTVAAVPRGAARDAGIALLATWSRTPLLDHGDVQPGTQVTSLGADEPGKAELGPALLAAGRVLVDDVPLALSMGAPGTAGLSADGIAGAEGGEADQGAVRAGGAGARCGTGARGRSARGGRRRAGRRGTGGARGSGESRRRQPEGGPVYPCDP